MPRGSVSGFDVGISASPAGGGTRGWTFTVVKTNAAGTQADTALSCSITTGNRICSDNADTVAVDAGEQLSVKAVPTSPAPTNTPRMGFSANFTTTPCATSVGGCP
jgi:hypothetical protein